MKLPMKIVSPMQPIIADNCNAETDDGSCRPTSHVHVHKRRSLPLPLCLNEVNSDIHDQIISINTNKRRPTIQL